ncbi:MAG TPA: glycosyltransferase family 39 protein [Chthoniobacteraceae bacterium]|nr:glycosyltransferase family 39 protein [Chthoniobacteraceae bacterium]
MKESSIQRFIHRLEEGRGGSWLRLVLIFVVCVAALVLLVFDPFSWRIFKGISHPYAMEQAVVAREVARGHGYSTLVIRPAAMAEFKENGKPENLKGNIPETYHAPLWPLTLAPFFKIFESSMEIDANPGSSPASLVFAGDRIVLIISVILFYLALLVNFRTIARLFDRTIAWLTTGITFGCYLLWQQAMSGLPQMLLFLLFSLAVYCMVRASQQKQEGKGALRWLAAAAVLFGLMALTHPLTLWLFLGAAVYAVAAFKPRWKTGVVMFGLFLLLLTPWFVRNQRVSGNPFGLAWYSQISTISGAESAVLRSEKLPKFMPRVMYYRSRIQQGVVEQMSNVTRELGSVVVAPFFFLALLHAFKRQSTFSFRWPLLLMWGLGVVGMAIVGLGTHGSAVSANDLHYLFIPLFSAYGIALVMVLISRSGWGFPLFRKGVMVLLILVCTLPLQNLLLNPMRMPFHWPPYLPPYIAILNQWTKKNELIASDVPWAVAWYADRKSLWLPESMTRLAQIHDNLELDGRFAGVYLTPATGNLGFFNQIIQGEYKEWLPLILRSKGLGNFPFREMLPLPINGQVVFYSDWSRWSSDAAKAAAEVTEEELTKKSRKEAEPTPESAPESTETTP